MSPLERRGTFEALNIQIIGANPTGKTYSAFGYIQSRLVPLLICALECISLPKYVINDTSTVYENL